MALKLDKLSILIVEDTQPMNAILQTVLETMGVGKIYNATDGQQGFELFCRHNPDIVITDWHMPPVSGLALLERIRTSAASPNKQVPVIMITGYSAPERISKCRDQGVTEYLVKPFTAEDIVKRVMHVIKNPRDFIDSDTYFGPDRRRRVIKDFQGKLKRETDRTA